MFLGCGGFGAVVLGDAAGRLTWKVRWSTYVLAFEGLQTHDVPGGSPAFIPSSFLLVESFYFTSLGFFYV